LFRWKNKAGGHPEKKKEKTLAKTVQEINNNPGCRISQIGHIRGIWDNMKEEGGKPQRRCEGNT